MAGSDFYIYVLFRETGAPFYVGKGHGDRWRYHDYAYGRDRNLHKLNIIRQMKAAGHEIPKIKLHEGLTEDVAYTYESALISAIGRADKGLGPLTNLSDGGEGATGLTPEQLERLAASQRGKKLSPEHIARIRAANTGRKLTPEAIKKLTAARHAAPFSPETRAKMSVVHRGKKQPPAAIAKTAAANRGRKRSPETRAKMVEAAANISPEIRAGMAMATSLAQRGRVLSPETRAKIAASRVGRTLSTETRAKITASLLGQKRGPCSADTRAKISAGNRGKKRTPEQRAKLSAAHSRRPTKARVDDARQHGIPGI